MKHLPSLLLAAALLVGCLTGCRDTAASPADSAPARTPTQFDRYVSNTVIATGCNKTVEEAENVTFRAYLRPEQTGSNEYCFYFSNTVDSTWDDGKTAYAGKPGGSYEICAAGIAIGTDSGDPNVPLTNRTAVTFDGGSQTKSVKPGETFWSDPVSFAVAEGQFLVWEWTVTGTDIPCICMSNMANAYADTGSGKLLYCNEIPLPALFGCDRTVKGKIAFLGDSITQGCQTSDFAYQFWVADIAKKIQSDYAVWNLGLGYSRASDAAKNGDWLARAKAYETVVVAFGTNDLHSGSYGGDGPDTAAEIEASLRRIVTELKNADCRVILFNAPPFGFQDDREVQRTALNAALPAAAEALGAEFFDFAALLADPADAAQPRYGGHPDDTGCQLIADTFLQQFSF